MGHERPDVVTQPEGVLGQITGVWKADGNCKRGRSNHSGGADTKTGRGRLSSTRNDEYTFFPSDGEPLKAPTMMGRRYGQERSFALDKITMDTEQISTLA